MYTAGFYKPDGKWTPESDYKTIAKATNRVNYLNGAKNQETIEITQLKREIMIIANPIDRIEVGNSYKIHIYFNINLDHFKTNLYGHDRE